ncbi:FAD-binding protein, partial [Pseudolysinimonas sp.]|uniref:FAD-binding protein n=1 Tax=Pseudolysinimonas sp. TaxID=2680009 RepID=UPI00286B7DC3
MHDLSSRLAGVVFERGDAGRTEELAGVNLAVVHDPDLVVGAATLEDVVEAVGYATRHGLAVRVQATGHGADLPVTDGLLLTTRRLDRVVIDGDVATIGAGVRWADVIAAAAPLGLAPVTGSSPTVGVVG